MTWLRMAVVAIRIAGPYWLTPWRSPLVRWRMETYGVLTPDGRLAHAEDITPGLWARFTMTHGAALWSFLRWAARLERE